MTASTSNAEQIEYWNARTGERWAQDQQQLDRQIQPLGDEAMRALAPAAGERVLDIGCGCGQTTLELAQQVGASGQVLGADISRPMLAVARARPLPAGGSISFQELDAQTADLAAAAGVASFDAAFSRFGVMFFGDPAAAFANIRRALRPGGRLAFVCWRSLAENDWMRKPLEAAKPLLPPQPPPDPNAPGPFAFADAQRVTALLSKAGFASVTLRPFDAMIGSGELQQTLALTLRIGPLGSVLREHPELTDAVAEKVRAVREPYDTPRGVLLPGAVWIVTARNP